MEIDSEKLIELVRRHPVLYDLSHTRYMDNNLKLRIWADIGKELNEDGSTCRARWNNIRDNYRKSLKKQEGKSGLAARPIKCYKYSDQLSFLKQLFEERSIMSNVTPEEGDDKNDNSNEEILHTVSESCYPSEVMPTVQEIAQNDEDYEPIPKKNKTDSKVKKETASSQLLNYLIHKNESINPIDAFLNGIAPTLKNFNPYYQNLVKSEIFNIVQKYELQAIMEENNSEKNLRQSTSAINNNMEMVSIKEEHSHSP